MRVRLSQLHPGIIHTMSVTFTYIFITCFNTHIFTATKWYKLHFTHAHSLLCTEADNARSKALFFRKTKTKQKWKTKAKLKSKWKFKTKTKFYFEFVFDFRFCYVCLFTFFCFYFAISIFFNYSYSILIFFSSFICKMKIVLDRALSASVALVFQSCHLTK